MIGQMLEASDFHSLYRNCFIGQIGEPLETIARELSNLVLEDSSSDICNQKIIETIKRMRVILAEGSNDSQLFSQLKRASSSIPHTAAFWLTFSPQIPFDVEKVQDLFVSRIKHLQNELKKLQIHDDKTLMKFVQKQDFFTQPRPLSSTQSSSSQATSSQIKIADFCNLYRNCFIYESQRKPLLEEVQREIANLILDDGSPDRDQKIIETIQRIRAILIEDSKNSKNFSLFSQLKEASKSIPNNNLFWSMFSLPSIEGKPVQTLLINRVKHLQDEFKKYQVCDYGALEQCVNDREFFTKPHPLSSAKSSSSKTGYFKPGADAHMPVGFLRQVNRPTIATNMYSEEELENTAPRYIDQIRNIRDGFSATAARGELIKHRIFLDPHTDQIALVPYDAQLFPEYPYVTTLSALIYNEIKNGRVKSLQEAYEFALNQLNYNLLLIPLAEKNIDLNKMRDICMRNAAIDFLPFFKNLEKQNAMQLENGEKEEFKKGD